MEESTPTSKRGVVLIMRQESGRHFEKKTEYIGAGNGI